jgi:hypothetical protein
MRTDDELRGAMKQVQFEFNRLFGTAMYMSEYLTVQIAPTPKAGPVDAEWGKMFGTMLSDAVLSSFLVHARNLIDFFIGPTSQRPDDIVAADFFQQGPTWSPRTDRAFLDQLRNGMAKRNVHLTYRRVTDKTPWNPRDIVERLTDLRDQFNAGSPTYLIAVNVDSLDEEPVRPAAPAAAVPASR